MHNFDPKDKDLDTGWRSLIERRQFPRLDVALPVTLRHNGRLIPATTLNISCGGMALATPTEQVSLGGHVEVVVDLGEIEKDVTLRGSVVHVNPADPKQLGIQFTNLFAVGHQSLQRYLKDSK